VRPWAELLDEVLHEQRHVALAIAHGGSRSGTTLSR
jgi:hypothetical protein